MHHRYNQIQRCKIQHICNVIQNVKGNAGAMKYNHIECNAGAQWHLSGSSRACLSSHAQTPCLCKTKHNYHTSSQRVSQKSEFCQIEHLQIGVQTSSGQPVSKIVFWSFFTKTKRDQAFPSPVDAKIWPHSLQF